MPAAPNAAAHDDADALVQCYDAAFNAGDRDAMLALLTDDIAHDLNQGPRETGRDAFAAFMQRMDRCYRAQLRDIVVLASTDGTRAAAEYVAHGGDYVADGADLPPASGQCYGLPGGAFFGIRGGRIARVSTTSNLDDWQCQVG